MPKEEWKEIPGYEGIYKVSNTGRIISMERNSASGKKLKEFERKLSLENGYKRVHLRKNGISKMLRVHRIVAIAFIGQSNMSIDHIDGNRSNNHVENLRYVTQRQNVNFSHIARKSKKSIYPGVHWNKNTGKWRSKFYYNKKSIHLGLFDTEIDAYMAYKQKIMEVENCQR
jgi:hypothetical protein